MLNNKWNRRFGSKRVSAQLVLKTSLACPLWYVKFSVKHPIVSSYETGMKFLFFGNELKGINKNNYLSTLWSIEDKLALNTVTQYWAQYARCSLFLPHRCFLVVLNKNRRQPSTVKRFDNPMQGKYGCRYKLNACRLLQELRHTLRLSEFFQLQRANGNDCGREYRTSQKIIDDFLIQWHLNEWVCMLYFSPKGAITECPECTD